MRGEHDLASILKITFMKIKHMIAASLLLLTGIQTANAVEWQMKQGPMITPWSETIDVNNILGEYPRPQMEREEWLNLNGVWDLRKAVEGEAYQADLRTTRRFWCLSRSNPPSPASWKKATTNVIGTGEP